MVLFQHEPGWMGRHVVHWNQCCSKVTNCSNHTKLSDSLSLIVFKISSTFHFVSVRVSNELGAGHPRATKCAVFVTVVESLLIGLLSMVIIMATKDHFAVLFTDSERMQKAVADLAYLLAITMVLNSIQPVISGIHST